MRVAFVPRSAEVRPLFRRFVRGSDESKYSSLPCLFTTPPHIKVYDGSIKHGSIPSTPTPLATTTQGNASGLATELHYVELRWLVQTLFHALKISPGGD